jgi:enoyl-CoA hydratase/carnithine racemase
MTITTDGEVRLEREGPLARITFDRPAARNAMTWTMYERLAAICAELRDDAAVRVALLRGAGGKAFIAGTDIGQFTHFAAGDDGVGYERTMEGVLSALETLPIPTVALLEGWAVGGGLAIAACCDFRIATPGTKMGVPIARTLGNCLSMQNYARIVAALGTAVAKRMLVLGDFVSAEEAQAAGFVLDVVAPEAIDARAASLCERLARNAPITMRVSKEMIRRIVLAGLGDGEDLVRETYGSEDFRIGVRAFIEKRDPQWTGR